MNLGVSLEDQCADLLQLADFVVSREAILGHKKVDLFASQQSLGGIRRIAVECKDYARRLTQEDVTSIYVNYKPLLAKNLIDVLLVVTRNGLTASALTMVNASRDLSHMTSADLFDQVMDFRPYLIGLVRQFAEQGLSSYYVAPTSDSGADLEALVYEWVARSSARPIAVLGSYGTGKTTLARRIAHVLASRAQDRSTARLPVLVRLGEISAEQSLEGLLGKLFTAHTVVRNYTFDVFMALNAAGRFVILLDGFDEMKHSLSWSEFRFNFRQLNRLVSGNSRVLLLGRPTAFLNDDEYKFVLRGVRPIGQAELRDPEWPEYEELHLAPFSEQQGKTFLRRYLEYKLTIAEDPGAKEQIRNALERRVDTVFAVEFADLARRPVQLKMLAEILPSWEGRPERLTVSRLYSHSINLIIERELDKIARHRFGVKVRREFARDIAVFLWKNRREMSITADAIPKDLIAKHLDGNENLESARRDLVAACFLDRKLGESLFFPHRSFQEFLVAEYLVSFLDSSEGDFIAASAIANEEIVGFMKDMISLENLEEWQLRFERSRGAISSFFADLWLSQEGVVPYLWKRLEGASSPWVVVLTALAVLKSRSRSERSRLTALILERIKGSIGRVALVYFWCILMVGRRSEIGDALVRLLRVETYVPEGMKKTKFSPEREMVRFIGDVELASENWEVVELSDALQTLYASMAEFCFVGQLIDRSWVPSRKDVPTRIVLTAEGFAELDSFQYKWCGRKRLPRRSQGS